MSTNKTKLVGIIAGTGTLILFVLPFFVFAADYIPLASIPGTTEVGKTTASLSSYLTGMYRVGIGAAGILAVLMLVWGGFQYATTEAVMGKSESRGIIMNVVWGLAVILGSYLLLVTINPRLVDIGLTIGNLNRVNRTRIPTPEETYGKFLDSMLQRVQATSQKARDIKKLSDDKRLERGLLQQKIDEGNYENDAELESLQSQINLLDKEVGFLDVQEVNVRNYENALDQIDLNSKNMLDCLTGYGSCQRYVSNSAVSRFIRNKILGGRSETQLQADEAEAAKFLDGAQKDANKRMAELRAAGLTQRADALQTKINGMTDQFTRGKDFGRACDGATKPMPTNWRSGDACP